VAQAFNTQWIWWRALLTAISSFQPPMSVWLSIQKAHSSSAVRYSITAMTCKKAVLKSPTRTRSHIALAAKVSRFKYGPCICSFELARSASSAIIKHANPASEKRSRFHPERAAGKRRHTEHARDSKAFSVCEPDFGDAVNCRT